MRSAPARQASTAPLLRGGGLLMLDDLLTPDWYAALAAECAAARVGARVHEKSAADADGAAGDPPRRFASASGGPVQSQIYADEGLHARLSALCGRRLVPTGALGTYSYYDRPGDFLGLHRDIRGCDVTLITCLHRRGDAAGSGALRVYAKSAATPLDSIDEASYRFDMQMQEGQSVLLLGGYVPHEVLPAAAGFARHVSVLCFEIQARPDER